MDPKAIGDWLSGEIGVALHVSFWVAVIATGFVIWRAMEWRYGGTIARLNDQIEGLSDAAVRAKPSQERRAIRERLGDFLERGIELQSQMADEAKPLPKEAAQEWLDELVTFLETHLDKSFVARLRDTSTVPIAYTTLKDERKDWWGGMRSKVYHVQEFIREMA